MKHFKTNSKTLQKYGWRKHFKKIAIYCPQGSGTLRQQLIMMHGIAWSFMVLDCIE